MPCHHLKELSTLAHICSFYCCDDDVSRGVMSSVFSNRNEILSLVDTAIKKTCFCLAYQALSILLTCHSFSAMILLRKINVTVFFQNHNKSMDPEVDGGKNKRIKEGRH